LSEDVSKAVATIAEIDAVPLILDVVCRSTGMGFAAVARVTQDRWIACAVRDEIEFGLLPGGELAVATTICDEIRAAGEAVIIDHVAEDQAYCGHPTPAKYGFQSYISMPIRRSDGSFFGTLCAIDPRPARLDTPETIGMFNCSRT
jgi:GAF domain-containing protein